MQYKMIVTIIVNIVLLALEAVRTQIPKNSRRTQISWNSQILTNFQSARTVAAAPAVGLECQNKYVSLWLAFLNNARIVKGDYFIPT